MGINWKVRVNNKAFWVAFIPALLLLAQRVAALFGVTLDLTAVSAKLLEIVEATFMLLVLLGVVNDPTTAGYEDSALAMTYELPKAAEQVECGDEDEDHYHYYVGRHYADD